MKVHDKYVIEIEQIIRPLKDVDSDDFFHETEPLAKIKGFKSLVFDEYGLDKLEKLDDVIKKIGNEQYESGYRAGVKNNELYEKRIEVIQNKAYKQGFNDGLSCDDLVDKFNKGYDKGFEEGKQHVIRAVAHHIDKTNDIVNILQIIDEYENDIEKKFSDNPLDETVDYIEHLKSTGMGKKKALDYLSKFIQERMNDGTDRKE